MLHNMEIMCNCFFIYFITLLFEITIKCINSIVSVLVLKENVESNDGFNVFLNSTHINIK